MLKSLGALIVFVFASGCMSAPESETTDDDAQNITQEDTVYSAMGQEPGWRLDLFADTFTLEYAYGEKSVSGALPEAEYTDGTTHYFVFPDDNGDGDMVEIIISDEYCADVMSGRPYPDKVVVMVNDEMLQGCGGDTKSLLTSNEWSVATLNGEALAADTAITMKFGDDNRVSGNGGCNQYGGSYEITGEGLNIGPLMSTKKACFGPVMGQENVFLTLLQSATRFEISDGDLVLFGADEGTITAAPQ